MALASVFPLVRARSLARTFTYEVPDGVGKGAVVAVRFGRAAHRGVVIEVGVEAPAGVTVAPIERVLYELPPALVDLALWTAPGKLLSASAGEQQALEVGRGSRIPQLPGSCKPRS